MSQPIQPNTSVRISGPDKPLSGTVNLPTSKSLTNRYLILQALYPNSLKIHNPSSSDDSRVLNALLNTPPNDALYDAHHGGTTSRFLLAYLALQDGTQILTGSNRLKERPIADLVTALNALGCNIEYLESAGQLPVKIQPPGKLGNAVSISGKISSQFISALLLIGSRLPEGLVIHLKDEIVSISYLQMTIAILRDLGIQVEFDKNKITIAPIASLGQKQVSIEGDWSAASYFLGLSILYPGSSLTLNNLSENSLQGDSKMLSQLKAYGLSYSFLENKLEINSEPTTHTGLADFDLELTPDIFQTYASIHAVLGIKCMYTGLQTLAGKETDRVLAMKKELSKVGNSIYKLPEKFAVKSKKTYYLQEQQAHWKEDLLFETYKDHRMAMSLSMLSKLGEITIQDSGVVSKSFPTFWDSLVRIGFSVDYINA